VSQALQLDLMIDRVVQQSEIQKTKDVTWPANTKHSDRDMMEPANICIRWMRISCAKSVGFGCGFVTRSKLPAIMATVIPLCYLKLSSCKRTSSEQLK